jgi:hypothetical protein
MTHASAFMGKIDPRLVQPPLPPAPPPSPPPTSPPLPPLAPKDMLPMDALLKEVTAARRWAAQTDGWDPVGLLTEAYDSAWCHLLVHQV